MKENKCIICGCTDGNACVINDEACFWINEEKTICSACAMQIEIAKLEEKLDSEFLKYHLEDDYIDYHFDIFDFLEKVAEIYRELLILKGKLDEDNN